MRTLTVVKFRRSRSKQFRTWQDVTSYCGIEIDSGAQYSSTTTVVQFLAVELVRQAFVMDTRWTDYSSITSDGMQDRERQRRRVIDPDSVDFRLLGGW